MRKFLIGFLGIILLWACNKKDDPEPIEPTVYDRTVLVYMSGENDLTEKYKMYNDLLEMDQGSRQLSDNQRLIVFIDSIGYINWPHIVEITKGQRKTVYQYDKDFAACDPQKFREIVKWTMDKYPSKEYGLVLWGHASGWLVDTDSVTTMKTRSYGYDMGYDIHEDIKSMNITQMAKALDGLPKFKYIFADCCNFMCAESAYELRNTADYLIGSAAEIPGDGAPYHTIMPALFSNSGTFYQDICNIYYDYYLEAYKTNAYRNLGLEGYSVPMSVIKLSEMESLAQATNQLLSTISNNITKPAQLDLSKHPFYFSDNINLKVMYDMSSVFCQYASATQYNQWLGTFNKAVPYSIVSKKWQSAYYFIKNSFSQFPENESQYGGVSMYFPQQAYDSNMFKCNSLIKNYQWYYSVNWSKYGW